MFVRAMVCSLFLVNKRWYVLQVLNCSRLNVPKLHRVFAVFICGSTCEKKGDKPFAARPRWWFWLSPFICKTVLQWLFVLVG